jgi:aspartate kinase
MKVMKFGGSCLRDSDFFLRVAEIILSEEKPVVVVVSAILGVTDMILDGLHESLDSEVNILPFIEALEVRHKSIVQEAIRKKQIRQNVFSSIEERLEKLKRLLYGVAYTKEITDSVKALILSYGERFCVHILSAMIRDKGRDSWPLESDYIGLITDDSFDNATADLEGTRENLERSVLPLVHKAIIPVITGYFGCTKEGKITTFGRNGTDYSAAVIAHGLRADELEIWKDVDGFMSADPKIVDGAEKIDTLSYYEAAELSYFGAKILHPRTVEPVLNDNISICIKNLKTPNDSGSRLMKDSGERKDIIKSVTYNRDISLLKILGPGVGYKPGVIAQIGSKLNDLGINIFSVITSQTCINLLIDSRDSLKSYDSIKVLGDGVIEKIEREDDMALVSVVGKGLQNRIGIAARAFSAVAAENINIEMSSSGASDVAYYFIIKDNDVEKTINAIHSEFFRTFNSKN